MASASKILPAWQTSTPTFACGAMMVAGNAFTIHFVPRFVRRLDDTDNQQPAVSTAKASKPLTSPACAVLTAPNRSKDANGIF